MIYDCFLFYNELELLDIRLHELDKVVDKFILTESTVTFTNKPKELFYQKNKHLFKKFNKKITHVVLKDSPDVSNPWIIEAYQLGAITKGLPRCKPNDTILVSCVDEIPKAERVLEWKNKPGKHKVFLQKLSYYYLNYQNSNSDQWQGTQMYSYKNLRRYKDPYIARFTKPDVLIPDGGWHFSYMGGIKMIQKKLASFSHQEYNNSNFNTEDKILRAIIKGEDFLHEKQKFKIVDENLLPQYVQEHKDKFLTMLISQNKLNSWGTKNMLLFYGLKNIARNIKRIIKDAQ